MFRKGGSNNRKLFICSLTDGYLQTIHNFIRSTISRKEKKDAEKICLSPMEKAPVPIENISVKYLRKDVTKSSITQRLLRDLGRSN